MATPTPDTPVFVRHLYRSTLRNRVAGGRIGYPAGEYDDQPAPVEPAWRPVAHVGGNQNPGPAHRAARPDGVQPGQAIAGSDDQNVWRDVAARWCR